jgi:hypothetical protein
MMGSEGGYAMNKMSDTPGPLLDNEARQIIRNKLLHYMHTHGIGVPRLAKRIKASHERGLAVTDKTLQRFLAGAIRTNDLAVAICHRFAESLTAFDSIAALGERLSAFYGAGGGRDYSGRYLAKTEDSQATAARLEVVSDTGFYRVTERMTSSLGDTIFDGVLVAKGDGAFVVLKDRFDGRARNYMIRPDSENFRACGASACTHFWTLNGKETSSIEQVTLLLTKEKVS